MQGDPNYPLNSLYLLDNTCRVAYGFTPTGNEPGICTPEDDSMIGQQGGSQSSNPTPPTGIVVLVKPTGTPASGGDDNPNPPPPENGTVSGQVWQDTNGDGIRQADEPAWSSEAVVLRTDGYGGTCNVTVATTLPNKSGNYQFTDVWPTPYCVVFLTSQPTGVCSTNQNVTVPAGGTATADFCVRTESGPPSVSTNTPAEADTGVITGHVCRDANLNGACDLDEGPNEGLLVTLDLGPNIIATTTTDASGNFRFEGLANGEYYIHGFWGGTVADLSSGGTVNLTIISP